jgi:YesN/AraC family two-component response regulator
MQDELLNNILSIMEDKTIIFNPKFTIDTLAGLIHQNHKYISEVINTSFNKNFRSFLNSYRIKEAQRLFLEKDTEKYTIEFVSQSVGFKSRSSFREIFKEITGVNPAFYIKSLKEQAPNE